MSVKELKPLDELNTMLIKVGFPGGKFDFKRAKELCREINESWNKRHNQIPEKLIDWFASESDTCPSILGFKNIDPYECPNEHFHNSKYYDRQCKKCLEQALGMDEYE